MEVTVDISENQIVKLVEQFCAEADAEIETPLSIIFDDDEPMLFFVPAWSRKYEARLPLRQALKTELDSYEGGEPDKAAVLKRLIAVLDDNP